MTIEECLQRLGEHDKVEFDGSLLQAVCALDPGSHRAATSFRVEVTK
jgi:hypothetical protein